MSNIYASITIDHITCGNCGVHFGLDSRYHGRVKDNGASFYCPNGHYIAYSETELDRQRQRADRYAEWLRQEEERLERERKAHAVTKGKLTKTKKRLAGGVCPCCNRTFSNLQRHMGTKHPGYAEELVVPGNPPTVEEHHPTEVIGSTLVERVAAILKDGEPHTAEEIAERLGAKLSTVRQYLWNMTEAAQRPSPGVFQVSA